MHAPECGVIGYVLYSDVLKRYEKFKDDSDIFDGDMTSSRRHFRYLKKLSQNFTLSDCFNRYKVFLEKCHDDPSIIDKYHTMAPLQKFYRKEPFLDNYDVIPGH